VRQPTDRAFFLGFGLFFTIVGTALLYRGVLGWTNSIGFVFGPFAVIAGILMFVAAFKQPSKRKRRKDRSGFAWGKGQK
jgi:hypothetical protein